MKAFFLILLCLLLSACQNRGMDETVFAMDTAVTFRLSGEYGRAAAEEAKRELVRLEALLDAEGETLQALSSGESVYQPELASLLARVREIEDATGGALDVTVYPAVRAWGFIDGAYRVPDEKELASLKPFVDYRQVSLDGAHISLPAGFSLTLGAVAKGYAADRLAAVCRASGVESGVLSLGGNVRLIGDKAGEPWKVAVRAPGGGNALTLALADVSVVTSGSYERYFEADGHVYHHIRPPKTRSNRSRWSPQTVCWPTPSPPRFSSWAGTQPSPITPPAARQTVLKWCFSPTTARYISPKTSAKSWFR